MQPLSESIVGRTVALMRRLHGTYRDSLATLMLRLASLAIAFVASILFARSIGPSGYGVYASVTAWATLLVIPAALGLPEYFLREFAHSTSEAMIRAMRWADLRLAWAGFAAAVLVMVAWLATAERSHWSAFLVASPIPLLAALTQTRQSALRQATTAAAAIWPQAVMLPALILVFAGVAWVLGGLSVFTLLVATTVAHTAAFTVTQIKFQKLEADREQSRHALSSRYSIRASLPFIGLAGLALLNTRVDILVLSSLSTPIETGVYSVAARVADVLLLPITVVNMVISPSVAKLHRSGNKSELQSLLTRSSRFALLLTGVPAVILLLFAESIIVTCFGPSYAGAAVPLRILAVAQIINASAGSVGMLLSMTGHEHSALRVGIISATLNFALNVVLVPLFGGVGASIGTAVSLIAWRLGFYIEVRRRLNMNPTAFGS